MQGKMITKWKALINALKEQVFKRYPITMALVLIGAVFLAIIVDFDQEKAKWITKICFAIWVSAAGTLFCEELLSEKSMAKYIGCGISAVIAIFFMQTLSWEADVMFGMETDYVIDQTSRVMCVYLVWIVVCSFVHMFLRSGHDFATYCQRAACGIVKTSIVYGIFALGLVFIVLIFNVLIFDTDEFLLRIEVFLAASVYLPGVLLSLSDTSDDIGKFFKVVIQYVLMPLTIAAFLIIYLYIAKLLVTQGLPSNEVFSILTTLFVAALPIWTVASTFSENIMGKIARILPYAFLPFIILQTICVGMRIGQYGLTESRYMGCFAIVFEVLYVVIYAFILQHLSIVFYVAAVLVTFLVLVPGTRVDDAVYFSQKSCLEKFISLDQTARASLSKHEKRRLLGAYREVQGDRRGKIYLKQHENEKAWIQLIAEEIDEYSVIDQVYIRASVYRQPVDVAGYSTLVECYGEQSGKIDLERFPIVLNDEDTVEVSISDYIAEAIKEQEPEPDYSYVHLNDWLKEHHDIKLATGDKLVLDNFSIDIERDEITRVTVNGFYLK